MNTVQKYFSVKPKDMAYVKAVVESYVGLAVLRTVDPKGGIMEWMIPPDFLEEVDRLVESLQEEIEIEPLESFSDTVSGSS